MRRVLRRIDGLLRLLTAPGPKPVTRVRAPVPISKGSIALLYMVFGTVAWSLLPLIVDKSGGSQNPFIFNSLYTLFASVGIAVYLVIWHRSELGDSDVWAAIRDSTRERGSSAPQASCSGGVAVRVRATWDRHVFSWAAIGRLSVLFLAWSASHIEVAVAAILYETWVIWFIVLRNFSSPERAKRLSFQAWVLVLFGFFGLALVNLAQGSGTGRLVGFGAVLALAGGLLAAVNVERSLKWGEIVRAVYARRAGQDDGHGPQSLELAFTMLCVLVLNLFSSVITLAFGLADQINGRRDLLWLDRTQFAWLAVGGALVGSAALLLFRKANIHSTQPEINAISYAAPALSVVALWAFSDIALERYDYFIVGLIILIAANVLLNLKAADGTAESRPPGTKHEGRWPIGG